VFPDETWCEHARVATSGLLTDRVGSNGRIQYDVRSGDVHHRWLQVIVDGRFERWAPGVLPDPDVEIHWTGTDAKQVLGNELDGTHAMMVTTVVEPTANGAYVGPPPPMDLPRRAELEQLPTISDATLTIQHLLTAGPFGDIAYVQVWVDGRVTAMWFGTIADPDVSVELLYRNQVRLREGSIAVLDALENGGISGSTGALALFAGLLETQPYQRALRACVCDGARALATLGEVGATPGYRAALAEVTVGSIVP
jgi:hypothetical protein